MMSKLGIVLAFTLFVLGSILYVRGANLPAYTDVAALDQLRLVPEIVGTECVATEQWYRDVDALRTARNPLMDSGGALMLTAVTLLAFAIFVVAQGATKLTEISTPQSLETFFGLGTFSIIWLVIAVGYSFTLDLGRDLFPWCADSISIGMFGMLIFGFMSLIVLSIVGLIISRFFGELPVPLMVWDASRPLRSWIWTVLAGVGVTGFAVLIADVALTAQFLAMPSFLIAIYVVLATRAALLAPIFGD